MGLTGFPLGWAAPGDGRKRHILMFTRSQGFEHTVIRRGRNGELSLAENIVMDLGKKHNFDVICTKDGREFLPQTIAKYDAFLFETTGDLTKEGGDKNPPMPVEGKQALLKAIADGKGFVGCHCASDTFHSQGLRNENQKTERIDPYIAMLGGEFISHGHPQKAWMRVTDKSFPGAKDLKDFPLHEEWYSLKNFANDLHVILVQDTKGMTDWQYERPSFPASWARLHGKGRVFYTSMGHFEEVWQNALFQQLLLGGLSWAVGNIDADISPNISQVAPQAAVMPKEPEKKDGKK
jgi:type 1 glutamine amidotransferase